MWPFNPPPATRKIGPDIIYKSIDLSFDTVIKQYRATKLAKGERIGLCLAGGGSKGRWQIGFLAFLNQIGVLQDIDCVIGTSVGGLNALITSRYLNNFQAALDVWRNLQANIDVYNGSLPSSAFSLDAIKLVTKLGSLSLLTTEPLYKMLTSVFGNSMSEGLLIPTYVVTSDYLAGGKLHVMKDGDRCVDMGMRTSAIPAAFPAWNNQYTDGGTSNNIPFILLEEAEKTSKMVILYCDQDPMLVKPAIGPPNVVNTAIGALSSLMNSQETLSWKLAETVQELRKLQNLTDPTIKPVEYAQFYPSNDTGNLLDFSDRGLAQAGYDDAYKYCTVDKLREFLLN